MTNTFNNTYSYDAENDLSLRYDNEGIPRHLVKNIGRKAYGLKPYLCFLIAHDILDNIIYYSETSECFLYRIWAVGPGHAEIIFMKLPEIRKYIKSNLDIPNNVKYMSEIDQWDALLDFIELDPLYKN